MKGEGAECIDEPLIQEKIPTAMEVALRQALEEADDTQTPDIPKQQSSRSRNDQEDILQRTLKHRVRTSSTDSS